ncbi:MAG TPA: hypothetical protein VEO19_17885 [Terriglobia bacterium]|nr:hypothetical protein [Terriglobia bacterium]
MSAVTGALGEKLHAHALLELESGALDMGQQSGMEECDERMGQFLLQQQAEETQQPWPWLLCASNDAPGTRERRSESNKAQAFCVIFMPYFFIANERENGKVKTLGWAATPLAFLSRCHFERSEESRAARK